MTHTRRRSRTESFKYVEDQYLDEATYMSVDELKRYTLPDGRVYTDGEDLVLPSVTTVLDQGPEPEGIKYWKKKNDGENGRPDWRDILQYKSNRGTMIHYRLLNEFSPDDIHGTNEEDSTEELKMEGNWDRYEDDHSYAEEAWEEIKEERGINEDSVLDVECFVTNIGVGYAGQFDLLYIDEDSNIVLADLKTGKGVYDKYKRQLVAYENALNLDIDRVEVIRISPDQEEWEISADEDWLEGREDLWAEFRELREQMGDVRDRMEAIVEEGVDDT